MSYTKIKSGHPKGRKDYRCEWCDESIPKGEKHFARTYIFDGDFNSGRMHLECEAAMHKSPHDELAEGWLPGDYKRGTREAAC
jgi:hypothetical protein